MGLCAALAIMADRERAEGRKELEKTQHIHDVVVIGASAGGFEALIEILRDLPKDLPASVFVVLHIGATSYLAPILSRKSQLPVQAAKSGEKIERGVVYVAVPDRHLLLHDDHILLRKGPRENLARPAIDPLFRSAAITFGGRVIGVILSGALNDGTAGLIAIKRCGGLSVAQDPADAGTADMPTSAIRFDHVDHVAKSEDIGPLLARLVREPAGPTPEIPLEICLETAIAAQEVIGMKVEEKLGTLSPFTCPECHGSLWEIEDGDMLRYRCHVGHAYTGDAMLSERGAEIEHMLEGLRRSNRERAALAQRMAKLEGKRNKSLADKLAARAAEYEENARLFDRLLANGAILEEDGEENQEGKNNEKRSSPGRKKE